MFDGNQHTPHPYACHVEKRHGNRKRSPLLSREMLRPDSEKRSVTCRLASLLHDNWNRSLEPVVRARRTASGDNSGRMHVREIQLRQETPHRPSEHPSSFWWGTCDTNYTRAF